MVIKPADIFAQQEDESSLFSSSNSTVLNLSNSSNTINQTQSQSSLNPYNTLVQTPNMLAAGGPISPNYTLATTRSGMCRSIRQSWLVPDTDAS